MEPVHDHINKKKSNVAKKQVLLNEWMGQFSFKRVPCKMATWNYISYHDIEIGTRVVCLDIWNRNCGVKTFCQEIA